MKLWWCEKGYSGGREEGGRGREGGRKEGEGGRKEGEGGRKEGGTPIHRSL